MSSKSKKRKPQISLTKSVTIAECIFLWAWATVYRPTQEDCDRMEAELRNVRESVATHRLNVWDIKQALKDEYGIEVDVKWK